jgi:hypothetical protein
MKVAMLNSEYEVVCDASVSESVKRKERREEKGEGGLDCRGSGGSSERGQAAQASAVKCGKAVR